jgi:hypothetical protein
MTEGATAPDRRVPLLTIKRMLVPLLARPRVAHTLKYVVYFSLLINLGRFVWDDYFAMEATLPADASLSDYLTQFSTSIDMLAWVGLVFLFELETYAVPDEKWTARLGGVIRSLRVICYVMIGYAAYGYTSEALENFETTRVEGISNICQLADQDIYLQVSTFEYEEITSDNCDDLSDSDTFYRIANEVSVIDEPTLGHVQRQGWIDIDNAYFWIIVVLLIEVEIWMQSRDRFSSPPLNRVRVAKTFFYLILIGNMFIWLFTGYYLYAWDAFLWIFGFWAIELNLAEWEMERVEELQSG